MKDKEIFIGIDVSKETLDISIAGKHYKIPNNKKSISGLYENHIIGSKVRLCVLESTGGYENKTMRTLQEYGISVHRAHPNKVYAFAQKPRDILLKLINWTLSY